MDEVLTVAIDAAKAAGEIALRYFRTNLTVETKADRTPVTKADRECEAVVTEILSARFLEHGFLGEELGERPGAVNARWIIDPIDGTKNFIRGIPFWAVLIGLEERGEITTGVIFNPVTGALLTARVGEGAFANGERIRVSDCARLADATLLHSSLNLLRADGCWEGFVRLVDGTAPSRGFGDYYGYDMVAQGKAELYVEVDLKPWDIAPVKIVVEEAGGRLTDFGGRPTIYDGRVLATNGRLHDEALALLDRARG